MRKFILVLMGIFSLALLSCEIGMGSEVDLDAPEITITSPKDSDNVHRAVRIEGTCKDNVKVTAVEIARRINGNNQVIGYGTIKGETWYYDAYLDEGDCFLICTAKDDGRATSSKSKAVLTLIVDDDAPVDSGSYIDRGKNIQISFMTKEKLESLDLQLVENKFIPQNERFSIKGSFSDSISISKVIINLYEDSETEPFISKSITASEITEGSIYLPTFSFTHEELVAARSSMDTGKHYLKVCYETYDDAENVGSGTLGYVLWYPESDYPGIEQRNAVNDILTLSVGSSIPVYFFDDDEIKEYAYKFITEQEKNNSSITADNVIDHVGTPVDATGQTETPAQISTMHTVDGVEKALPAGTYYLLLYVKDINDKTRTRFIEVSLSDQKKPAIRITNPKENEKPAIIAGADGVASSFALKGVVSDSAGCRYIKVAYIPERAGYTTSAAKQARAASLFVNEGAAESGEFVRKYTFADSKPRADTDGFVKEDFKFTFDLLRDFPAEMNRTKFLMFVVENLIGNQIYKVWNIGSDSDAPEFKITSPAEMSVVDYLHNNLQIRFKAYKSSNLGIKEDSYKVTRMGQESRCVYTFANGKLTWENPASKEYIILTIAKEELKNWAEGTGGFATKDTSPSFNFECQDLVGNNGSGRLSVVLSPLPALESITCDSRSGTYCTDSGIIFQAKFSDTVKVSGNPRLKLAGITGVSQTQYAEYVSETESDTIKFKYIVPENAKSDGVSIAGTQIELNGERIITGTQGNGNASISFVSGSNFWDSADSSIAKEIKLDGVKPTIKNIKVVTTGLTQDTDGNYYFNANKQALVEVEFSETVSVNGSVGLKLSGIEFSQYSMTADGKKIVYAYTVAQEFESKSVKYNFHSCFEGNWANIKDAAGNPLKQGTDTDKDLKIILDTKKPGIPSANGIDDGGIYNAKPEITVAKDAGDADIKKLELSIDNGQTWIDCSAAASGEAGLWTCGADGKVTINNGGTYNIIARATDKAGNVSDNSAVKQIKFNDKFPEILDIKVACQNGNYRKGAKLKFQIFLGDTLKPYEAASASITFATINAADGSTPRTINVKPNDTGNSSILEFEHTVTDGTGAGDFADNYKGIKITAVNLSGLQDKYDNKQDAETTAKISQLIGDTTGGCYRPGIFADGVAPAIASTVPADNKVVASSYYADGKFTITLNFMESVYKESGTITLQRKGKWGIPAVMTVADFNKVFNSKALTVADKEILVCSETGAGNGNVKELLDKRTGIAAGPYKKITHGLKKNGSSLTGAPDLDTKFVLDFNLGLFDGETYTDPHGRNKHVTVEQIRQVFEKTGYHQHSIQMNSSAIVASNENKTYTITFPVTIQEGIEWELLISPGAFRDEVGNLFAGLKGKDDTVDADYTLWTNNASAPVVRVDRYSHGYGAREPDAGGTLTEIKKWTKAGNGLQDDTGGKIAPTGYARVRVDSQTPGATLHYKTINKGAFNGRTGAATPGSVSWKRYKLNNGVNEVTTEDAATYTFNDGANSSTRCSMSEIPDATESDLSATSGFTAVMQSDNTGKILIVGDGSYETACKDYVTAYATLDSAKTDGGISMTQSANGAEGVFKTVVYVTNYENGQGQLSIEGGTAPGGEPKVAGFPVRDGESEQYSKNAYAINDSESIWVSYDIVSTKWAILLRRKNNTKNYPISSYGQATFTSGYVRY